MSSAILHVKRTDNQIAFRRKLSVSELGEKLGLILLSKSEICLTKRKVIMDTKKTPITATQATLLCQLNIMFN